ncbi:hypothetical protein ZWY2020_033888 [Hordeum vulgare]|nr:hypothetical protein ZWY2020_033888 [Hordeum vulgare]
MLGPVAARPPPGALSRPAPPPTAAGPRSVAGLGQVEHSDAYNNLSLIYKMIKRHKKPTCAGAEPAAALEAVSLVAPVAAAAQDVPLAAARAAGSEGRGADHDTSELARLMQVAELLGAAEVAAADEDLRERDPAGAQEEHRELLEVAGSHGKVALVDGGAEPPRDGAYPR